MGRFCPALVQASSGGRAGHGSPPREETIYTGALVPHTVPSEPLTLLCTAGPGCGDLVKVSSSFTVLQGGITATWTVGVLPCFLFDGHCDQLRSCQRLLSNWPGSGPPTSLPWVQPFSFFPFCMHVATTQHPDGNCQCVRYIPPPTLFPPRNLHRDGGLEPGSGVTQTCKVAYSRVALKTK